MRSPRHTGIILTAIGLVFILVSCTVTGPAGSVRLNDRSMDTEQRLLEEFESNFQSYKEGAVGGNNGNGGAGCGCN